MTTVRIVPIARPNADSIPLTIDLNIDLSGSWVEVEQRLAPHIPEGWTLVALSA